MQTLRILVRCLKDRKILQNQKCVKPARRFTSSSSLPNFILVDMEEQDDVETDDDIGIHPVYPILGNRYSDLFYMPHSVGPAYQDLFTTADQFDVSKYHNSIGWNGIKPIRAQVVRCPKLLLSHMKRLFTIPCSKFKDPGNFSIFNLYFDSDVNSAIKAFVLIASQYSVEFMQDGYWSDFVNPFTGRAYFRPATRRTHCTVNQPRCLGHNIFFKDIHGCTVIKEAKKCTFAGAIFSDVPVNYFD
ncbi:PREDICTED: methylmalonic aciduria and homocystinuria type D homolog, mitochondrial [Drosophila arizonae]|uniref:Methylmalonic aciduria and homocystinuria type D homolog, mitochondrial n=1 Tax=Drosophila arizonae TaxID=7263 RepID=A0ABM1NUS5_DROAR|nr:PREDICTED: methylmalonic aciduria and homocystinuria type D homolog, mitochondrial [Drosophila arizonae]